MSAAQSSKATPVRICGVENKTTLKDCAIPVDFVTVFAYHNPVPTRRKKTNGIAPAMNANKTFTVVVPLYNKAPHVKRALDSILYQTLTDFELLVINDASTDGSVDEVLKFSDPRLRLMHRDTPGPGGYAARNLGISEARGKWIAFLDADDEWFPDHLEKMAELAEHFPDAQFLSCGWKNAWPGGKVQPDAFYSAYASDGPREISFHEYLCFCIRQMPPTNTYVACLRNNDYAKEIFPAGKAKRGGDLHAWALYLGKTKKLAWSPHLGAVYNRDVINSVTQSAPANTALLSLIVAELSPVLDPTERRQLSKYCNRRAWDAWRINVLNASNQSFILATQFSWRDDILFCLTRSAISMIPGTAIRGVRRLRRASRDAAGSIQAGPRKT